MRGGRHHVRQREDVYEMRCDHCEEWWPLSQENWYRDVLWACRACYLEYKRLKQAGYMADEAKRQLAKMKERLRYRLNRDDRLAKNRAWKAANRERIAAYNKAYRERHREEIAAQQRERYHANPELSRLEKRIQYQQETPEQRARRLARDRARYAAKKAAA